MPYRFVEHTADVGLEVSAETLPQLFSDALQGMTDVVTEVGRVGTGLDRQFAASAERLDLLLLEFLSEALFHFDVDQELFREAHVELAEGGEGWSLTGTAVGESLDPDRHPMKVMIKAVTYHQLEVARDGSGWWARVIFDI